MAIFIGQFGDSYASQLLKEYQQIAGSKSQLYTYCLKQFPNGEYKIRIVDKHCGNGPGKCDNSCKNPSGLGKILSDSDVFFVARGKYGAGWNSDRILGIAMQGAEILRSGSPEYFGGNKARRLYGVIPHEGFTKQDHIFRDEVEGKDILIEGEPITIRMNRRRLKDAGYDYVYTVYPHDYRREGWVRKVARKGELDKYETDFRNINRRERVGLEDWTEFLWSIDPTLLFPEYIKTNGIRLDSMVAPDFAASTFTTEIKKGLGFWEKGAIDDDYIGKKRSRKDSTKLTQTKGLDPRKIEGKVIGLADDWVLTGGTIKKAITQCDELGAREIHVFGVHGEFTYLKDKEMDAHEILTEMKLKNAGGPFLHFTDTVDNPAIVIPTAKLVAQALNYVPEQYYIGN